MDAQELSLQDLEIMDENGDGEVTRAEFLEVSAFVSSSVCMTMRVNRFIWSFQT